VVLKLPGVQHLYSPIEGKLASNPKRSVVEILEKLHPTPAVAGSPREKALQWLARFEELERGWYSGAVGWVNDRGEGDFAIALRSALIRDKRAIVHAGAGIVSGSVPEAELRETEMKMKAALSVLTKA
jgi:isochorismate synthase EntC